MKYIVLSAVLFAIPDFFPFLSTPCSFIFLIPLFITFNTLKKTVCDSNIIRSRLGAFFEGFAWGVITCSIKCYWFLILILTKGCSNAGTASGIALWTGTIVWLSIFSGLWLWTIKESRILTRFLLTIIYFCFMMFCCLFPYGVLEGYPFFNPLLTLAYYPQLLWCIEFIGLFGCLICLIAFQLSVAQLFVKKQEQRNGYVICALLCLFPFVSGLFFYQAPAMHASHMRYLAPWWYGCNNAAFIGYKMAEDLERVITAFPQTRSILMPESTFCFEIDDYESFVSLWSERAQGVEIMFGGHRRVGGVVLNSFMIIRNGKIRYIYDKQHLMPCVERATNFFGIWDCCNILVRKTNIDPIVYNSKPYEFHNDLMMLHGQIYQIFICSEFFFEVKKVRRYPIILIWNESWFCCDYMQTMAILYIKYFELKHNVVVLYASTQGKTNVG